MADSDLARRRIGSLKEELAAVREKSRNFRRAVTEALEEAGNPVRIGAQNLVGGTAAVGLTMAIAAGVNALRKPEDPNRRRPGQAREPSGWTGLATAGAGAALWAGNLLLPYQFPMGLIRGTVGDVGLVTTMFGVRELADAGLLLLERKRIVDQQKVRPAQQSEAAQLAAQQAQQAQLAAQQQTAARK